MASTKLVLSPAKQHALNTKQMFDPNPLSLSVPEPEFESWLRDSGYLEILDQRSTDLHRLSSSAAKPPDSDAAAAAESTTAASIGSLLVSELLSRAWTLLSLLTFNPLSKLATADFSGDTPPWTLAFFGSSDSYSFPSSPSQARLRVQENVKRFARNYTTLFVVFFACSLYQLPIALLGILSCLAIWDAFKLSSNRWGLDRHPLLRQILIRAAQCLAAIILFISNIQFALLCATGVSYIVMILHASFRKLTPAKQPDQRGGFRKVIRRQG